jgi:two-component system chemotaxis response regulator CheY
MAVRGLKVLVVDDSPTTTELLKTMLKKLGHEVVGMVRTGSEALAAYQKLKPDVVTMDIVMPDMDGIEATKRILAHHAPAIIVMVTSIDRMTMVVKALAAGARGYVAQPIEESELGEVIQMTRHHRAIIDRGALTWEQDRPGGELEARAGKDEKSQSLRTLVVEDSPVITGVLRKMLSALGHNVIGAATSGKEAIAAYRATRPNLVTMDIVMPDMDGIEATKQIIALDPKALIIMITAQGRDTSVVKALAAGARGYVVQPVDARRLSEVIELSQKFRAKMVNGHLTWAKD